ncbi:MAG: NAD-binding protein, partial [Armatimonadota bacterium]
MPVFRGLASKWHGSRLFRLVSICVLAWFLCGVAYWWFEYCAAPVECETLPVALVEMLVLLSANEIMTVPKSTGGMATAVLAALLSVILVAALIAEIAAVFIASTFYKKEGTDRVALRDHILVCHAGPSLPDVIKELTSKQQAVQRDVAIISMEPPGVSLTDRVQWVRGDPTHEAILERAGIECARAAIIFCRDMSDPVMSDSENLLTALAIESRNPDVYTCVELIDERKRKHFRHAEVDEVICVAELSKRLSVQSVLNPGLSRMICDLLSFDHTEEIYRVLIPAQCVG